MPASYRDGKRTPALFEPCLANLRRTIERALSVLCTVFHLEQLGSRSGVGLLTRLSARLLAYTLSFLIANGLPTI